jgi:hypothetical protein
MVDGLIMFWTKKQLSEDYVEVSIGRIYFKVLTPKLVSTAKIHSTIYGNVLNNELFFNLIEKGLLDISSKLLSKASLADSQKIRIKTKEILLRHGVIEAKKKEAESMFNASEVEWFEKNKPRKVA